MIKSSGPTETDSPDPRLQGKTAGFLVDQAPMQTAQNDGTTLSPVGQGGHGPGHRSVKSEHQSGRLSWVRNEPEVGNLPSATNQGAPA